MTARVAIVGCGASKLAHAAPARELYTGPLFRAAVADVEARGLPWVVASAKHGLVEPARILVPYDTTIAQRKALDLRTYRDTRWGSYWTWPSLFVQTLVSWLWFGLRHSSEAIAPRGTPVVVEVHAGRAYVEAIRAGMFDIAPDADDPRNRDHWAAELLELVEPARGLEVGERLGFYRRRRETALGAQVAMFGRAA